LGITDEKKQEEMEYECTAFARFIKEIHELMAQLVKQIGSLM